MFSGQDPDAGIGIYGIATHAPGWRDDSGVDEAKLNLLSDLPVGAGQLRLRAAGTVLNQETAGFIQGYNSYLDEDPSARPIRIRKAFATHRARACRHNMRRATSSARTRR